MIPLSLTIKGLYSYQEAQTIEFDRLLDGQLFGIFGSVGSGKSSILEAMTFALYGQSERLDRNDNRNYNMMNLKSDELLIDFMFRNFDEQEYRFTVKGKRNGKDFDKVNTFERTAYKKTGNDWLPLESSLADGVLGLSYDNFRRTIIIPQGKFQEFLQLGDKERTNMLKEIFQLDKYEFFYQTTSLEKKNNEAMQELKGQLLHFDQVHSEAIAEKEIYVSALLQSLENERQRLEKQEQELKEQEGLKKLFEALAAQKEQVNELLAHDEEYRRHAKKINDYEYCLRNFKEGLNRKKQLQEDIDKRSRLIAESNSQLSRSSVELEELSSRYETIKQEQQKQDERRAVLDDYQCLVVLKNLQSDIGKLDQRLTAGKPHLENALVEKTTAEQKIAVLKEQIRDQKANLPDIATLSALRNWHLERKNLEKHIENLKGESIAVGEALAALPQQVRPHLEPLFFEQHHDGKTFLQYTQEVQHYRALNRKKQNELTEQLAHYQLQLKLGEFAEQMKNGGPCLLCGSEHHPELLMVEDVNEHLLHASKQAEEYSKYDQSCEQALVLLHGLQQREQNLLQQLEVLENKLKTEKSHLDQHLQKFVWDSFDPDDALKVEDAFRKFEMENRKLQELERELDDTDTRCRKGSEAYEKFRKAIEDIQTQLTGKRAEEATIIRQLKVLRADEFGTLSVADLESKMDELRQKLDTVAREFELLSQQIDEHKSKQISLLERIRTNQDVLLQDETLIQQIKSNLQECFEKSEFSSWEEIELLLNDELDIDALKVRVSDFKQRLHTAKEMLAQLERQTAGKAFNEVHFRELVEQVAMLRDNVQDLNDRYVQEKAALEKQKKDLEQKQALQHQLGKLEKRAANLGTMKQLFKGSGFVNYVSSVYLHHLCEAANERFYKLTRQSLRLEVTEKNEFQVRDFLNNGKVRNVKTLSGGQTFQASLSLALALAESVQQQNKSKQNFFFLDEGFGSLDKESLQVAFETLKSLRKENRKVGIISHVEDLQQEIDVFLRVSNDPFSGSRIRASWE
ncbi:SbcC/MukB-like Walker B domain-containing protein [Pedobacter sp. SYSU D00535]|uniref:AAA family ATPase n=1 Tax=Pedobacter sp. SYSU D00535 TaxID=2810308 RepID=UPI001A957187|nr:SMC family ATPase [Pedobacter sp. SYSU D00535]